MHTYIHTCIHTYLRDRIFGFGFFFLDGLHTTLIELHAIQLFDRLGEFIHGLLFGRLEKFLEVIL